MRSKTKTNRDTKNRSHDPYLRTVPTNTEVFLGGVMTIREKPILARAMEIQKENWGEPRIFQW